MKTAKGATYLELIRTADGESDVVANPQVVHEDIEYYVRRYPDQWSGARKLED